MKLGSSTFGIAWAICAFFVLASVPESLAQDEEFASALSAMDLYSGETGVAIVGVVGFYGQPAPPQWMVLSRDGAGKGRFRETVVSRGRLASERVVRRLPGQDLPTIPIPRARVRVDSGKAFSIAEGVAKKKKLSFESAHFQLRCRDQDTEPVWVLSLIDRFQVGVATIYLSAESGEVLRTRFIGAAGTRSSVTGETRNN